MPEHAKGQNSLALMVHFLYDIGFIVSHARCSYSHQIYEKCFFNDAAAAHLSEYYNLS